MAEGGNGAIDFLLHASMCVARERGEWWSVRMLLCHHVSAAEESLPKRMYALDVSSPPKQRQKHKFFLSHASPPPPPSRHASHGEYVNGRRTFLAGVNGVIRPRHKWPISDQQTGSICRPWARSVGCVLNSVVTGFQSIGGGRCGRKHIVDR